MEKNYKPTPEILARIEKVKERLAHEEVMPLELEELDEVSGGSGFDRPPLDPTKEINGWTFDDLFERLGWVYESFYDGTTMGDQKAKDITVGVANDFINSALWSMYKAYPYPTFISQPMWRMWCPNEYGM